MRNKVAYSFAILVITLFIEVTEVHAASFDPEFYAEKYPDVRQVFGTDAEQLYKHYIDYGIYEHRTPCLGAQPGEKVDEIKGVEATQESFFISLDSLANYASIKKNMTNAEFQAAYDKALSIVIPIKDKSRKEQLDYIARTIRSMVDTGQVIYSTSDSHYNDPYGYFVLGVGSCAGETRAIGLCLNILGISYEHVNENQWAHQWARVPMEDGTYWICDAYGLYCGPEPSTYCHPYH